MATKELLDRIAGDARDRLAAVRAEETKEVVVIRGRLEAEVAKLRGEARTRIERETSLITERQRSQARLDERKTVLAAKWRVIDRAFDQARKRVLESKEYPTAVASIIENHAPGDSTVMLSEADASRLASKLAGRKVEQAAIAGGVVIRQGRQFVDYSLDVTLGALRNELAGELARVLFPEESK